jgi:cytochrome c oxidase cbb3-type subunit 3/ubiquinol-cytochrome c reductase cytochrome c subunit
MSAVWRLDVGLCSVLFLTCAACANAPGHPSPGPEVPRPDQVLDFATLFKQNCAACHGATGKNGAAFALANPVYLAFAGKDNVRRTAANGVAGKLMPPFAKSAGGILTDAQIDSIVDGIFRSWSRPAILAASPPPPYQAVQAGDPAQGQTTFAGYCSRCHGPGGTGSTKIVRGPIADPSFLALISDQNIRSTIVGGRPDLGMPDWRSITSGTPARPITDRQITDIVAWLASQRTPYPGQPYVSKE